MRNPVRNDVRSEFNAYGTCEALPVARPCRAQGEGLGPSTCPRWSQELRTPSPARSVSTVATRASRVSLKEAAGLAGEAASLGPLGS